MKKPGKQAADKPAKTNQAKAKQTRLSQSEFPRDSLEDAARIAHGLWDHFAGKGAAAHRIALALKVSPTSSAWRRLTGAAIAYGLTEGGYNADQITLTDLGKRIVAPTEEGDDLTARVQAMMEPRLLKEFYQKYNRAKFPRDDIAQNVLIDMGLPKDRAEEGVQILKANGRFAGVIQDTTTGPYVAVDTPVAPPRTVAGAEDPEEVETETLDDGVVTIQAAAAGLPVPPDPPPAKPEKPAGPKQLFVAHGKNRKAVEDLKKILNEFKIPYKVAIDEANRGRPISAKVADLMHECSAGIFIFTKDEKFTREGKDGEQEEIWRPSENVVYELGAANILWDRKIIIVREDGVNFPSDFSDLGYITFSDGGLAAKALDILKELIALELVKISA